MGPGGMGGRDTGDLRGFGIAGFSGHNYRIYLGLLRIMTQRYNRGFEGESYLLTNEHIFCTLFQILNFHYTYSFWNLGWAERAEGSFG